VGVQPNTRNGGDEGDCLGACAIVMHTACKSCLNFFPGVENLCISVCFSPDSCNAWAEPEWSCPVGVVVDASFCCAGDTDAKGDSNKACATLLHVACSTACLPILEGVASACSGEGCREGSGELSFDDPDGVAVDASLTCDGETSACGFCRPTIGALQ